MTLFRKRMPFHSILVDVYLFDFNIGTWPEDEEGTTGRLDMARLAQRGGVSTVFQPACANIVRASWHTVVSCSLTCSTICRG
jgi:hypothetical protein